MPCFSLLTLIYKFKTMNKESQETTVKKTTTHPAKRFFKRFMLWLVFVSILTITIAILVCNYTYSEGNRAGMLMKFSKKGYIMKTYEGELNQGGINPLPGNTIANNIWVFSVKDKVVAQKLMELEGKMVRLHYREQVRNLPWQGDTKYFVDEVTVIK